MKLLIRWLITVIALAAAVWLVPGIYIEGTNAWIAFFVMAVILGFVNAFVKPILAFFSCAFIILTMGLFLLVINAASLWFASWISQTLFNIGFFVDGFWSALFGSIIVSFVSFFLTLVIPDD